MVALSIVLAGAIGDHLGFSSHFVVVGVVRQMHSRVVGMSNYIIATCGMDMASGKLK